MNTESHKIHLFEIIFMHHCKNILVGIDQGQISELVRSQVGSRLLEQEAPMSPVVIGRHEIGMFERANQVEIGDRMQRARRLMTAIVGNENRFGEILPVTNC